MTLIARGEHYNEIKKNGLVFKSKEYNLDICQKFDVYQDISNIGKFDLVINGLKAHSAIIQPNMLVNCYMSHL